MSPAPERKSAHTTIAPPAPSVTALTLYCSLFAVQSARFAVGLVPHAASAEVGGRRKKAARAATLGSRTARMRASGFRGLARNASTGGSRIPFKRAGVRLRPHAIRD